jgi:flagellar hook-basal body complex protein FliE
MQIQGMSSITTQPILPPVRPPTEAPVPAVGGTSGFGHLVHDALRHVEQGQNRASASIQDLLTGKSQDILPVVAEVAKADMSFKLLMAVRNKVIEAYKQTINMQI